MKENVDLFDIVLGYDIGKVTKDVTRISTEPPNRGPDLQMVSRNEENCFVIKTSGSFKYTMQLVAFNVLL